MLGEEQGGRANSVIGSCFVSRPRSKLRRSSRAPSVNVPPTELQLFCLFFSIVSPLSHCADCLVVLVGFRKRISRFHIDSDIVVSFRD